jgi:NCAIR mutase (PurE)-related protein
LPPGDVTYHERARCIVVGTPPAPPDDTDAYVAVASAGTADLPVAEEAVVTLETLGSRVVRLYDVGVAGLHRLLDQRDVLARRAGHHVVAGMEGALASVVGGLVGVPVVACPTSVGYGAHFGGLAPLLTMLNSCATGVAVVNIDNGFGAAYFAHLVEKASRQTNA